MSNIPIVQGVTVDPTGKSPGAPYQNPMAVPMYATEDYDSHQHHGNNGMQQAKQPNQFRDVVWAVLFIAHLIPVVLYALYSTTTQQQDGGQSITIGPHIYWISIVALVSVSLSTLSLDGMMRYADTLVKAALIFSVCFSLLIGVFGAMSGNILMAILGFLSFAIGICYARVVWNRLPFAAANLRTALSAVKLNMGLVMVAYLFMALGFGWSILFFLGFGNGLQQSSVPVVFLFFLSFYWTNQVLMYTVHVICAGVVATWWFSPIEASSCFSSALQDSTVRAMTYSFGSICFGAFLVAIVKALRATLEYARNNDDMQILVCLIDCILSCIQGMIEYLNKWSYIYVGMYGFSYLDAGREVINLFRQKGWDVIITDDLVDNVLFLISIVIGLVSGLVGLVAGKESIANAGVEEAGMAAFGISFLIGLVLSNIVLGVVSSAVNTVIVCYCEAPAEFERNHPQLSADMRGAWTNAWPELNLY